MKKKKAIPAGVAEGNSITKGVHVHAGLITMIMIISDYAENILAIAMLIFNLRLFLMKLDCLYC